MITSKEIESALDKQSPGPEGFRGKSYKTKFGSYSSKKFPKTWRDMNACKHILQDQHYTDTETREGHSNKKNYKLISLKNIGKKIQQHISKLNSTMYWKDHTP